jgi:molybdate transport system ATP-binding protein
VIEASLRLARGAFSLAVDLRLPARGVSALFGPSGCGKTTLLRALAGLERGAGRVAFGDVVWQDDASGHFVPTHRRALGYVIQEAALFAHLDVRANLAFGERRAAGDGPRIPLPRVVELLGIGALLGRRTSTLSGGERQRVAIARALAAAPRLLLMDEPLAALDVARKAEILPTLERLHQELALPIVYVTHAIDEVARLADHLVLLDAGRVRASGALAELLARPELPLARQDDAGVVIEARVAEHDGAYGLARIEFAGGALWVGRSERRADALGQRVRARVLARDVSVTREAATATSILNIVPVRLEAAHSDAATCLLRLACGHDAPATGDARLLARITRRSFDTLGLRTGDRLYAQVKGVALMG